MYADSEPKSYTEAMKCMYAKQWNEAMVDEIKSFCKNHTRKLVPRLKNQKLWTACGSLKSIMNLKIKIQ